MPQETPPGESPVLILDSNAPKHYHEQAELLSDAHGYAIIRDLEVPDHGYALFFGSESIELRALGKGAPGPISASFTDGKNAHRMQFGGGKGQLIAKAVGVSSGVKPKVLDATAGLGRDAFVLATLGCQVEMFERVPVVEALLSDALSNAMAFGEPQVRDIVSRMKLRQGDSLEWLTNQEGYVADVIYLDPMYPAREKSAAVKKEMRAFHSLVGENPDDAELLEFALKRARCRVVVKRPRKGLEIKGPEPQLQLKGKSSRYDIYTLQSLNVLKELGV